MRSRIAIALVAAAASAQVLLGQQPPQDSPQQPQQTPLVFRSGVEAVRLDAFVTDKKGNPVTDLTADDFEVRESGTLQAIQQFYRVDLPLPAANRSRPNTTRPAGPIADVMANGQDQGRIYVIVLGSLGWQGAVRATKIVQRFLDRHFDDADLGAVVTLDRGGELHFTNDRTFLMKEASTFVDRLDGEMLWLGRRMRSRLETERAAVFGDIARALGHIDARRKSILFISEGLGFDPYDAIDMPRSSFSEGARAAMDPIMRGNLTVYPIYPLGVKGPMELRNMRALAYVTGAEPIGTDINSAFRRIVRDNSMYYVLGYTSTNDRRDGRFVRIEVRVKRPGLKVRARDGYFVEFSAPPSPNRLFSWNGRSPARRPFEPPVTLTSAITKALASPVALSAVPMKVFAAPFKTGSREGSVSVVVEIDASALDLARSDDALTGQFDVAVAATSGTRTRRGDGHTYDVTLRGNARERVLRNGLRVTSEIRLNPGQYRLRVAAGTRGGRTGMVLYDIAVPDFAREALMMSGISITSAAAADVPTFQPKDARPTGLPGPPTASREFTREDTIVLFTELYENLWDDSEHAIVLRTELRAEDGGVIPMTSEQRSSKTPQITGGGHGFLARLPLNAVPPGAYALHVEARADTGARRAVTRDIPIRVR